MSWSCDLEFRVASGVYWFFVCKANWEEGKVIHDVIDHWPETVQVYG